MDSFIVSYLRYFSNRLLGMKNSPIYPIFLDFNGMYGDFIAFLINSFKKRGTQTRNTIDDYLQYMEDAFLVQEAKRFDVRGKEYISGQQKYYFTDLGLRNARLNFRQFDRPCLLENAVYNELIMRGYRVDVGCVKAKVKNEDGKWGYKNLEADFVVHDPEKQMYIQVTEGIDDIGKKEQEMASLMHIRDGFPKMILMDQDVPPHYLDNGIQVMSIQDFMLKY